MNNIGRLAITVGIASLVGCIPPAALQFFIVNTVADTIDASVGDGICADASGNCSLRAAVMEANADTNITEIQLTGGETYTLSIAGAGEDGALTGDLDLLTNIYIRANIGTGQATINAAGLDRAIHAFSGSLYFLEGLILTGGNSSEPGGALLANSGLVAVEDTRITGNSASIGGGIYVAAGTLWMEDSTVDNNTAEVFGGGMYVISNAIVYQSTFTGNSAAGFDAQIGVEITGAGQLQLLNSTVVAGFDAFALDLFVGNARISNSIITSPFVACATDESFGPITSDGFNIASDDSCLLTAAGDQENIDPQLLPLQDNGGPIPTMLLNLGSPAINNRVCPESTAPDARQQPRPSGVACDAGAIEMQPGEGPGGVI